MFVLTLGKTGLRRLGAVAVAGVALAGVLFAAGSFWKGNAEAVSAPVGEQKSAAPNPAEIKISNSEGLDQFFKAYGLEVDLADSLVDKVKIPKKWDESFSAFNTVVKDSGFDLEKYKGKTVEKWLVHCPSISNGQQKTYGVVLVYKQQPVGTYLLYKPSGEVTGLAMPAPAPDPAAQTNAPLTEEEAAAAAAEFGSEAPEVQANTAPAEQTPQQTPGQAGEQISEANAEAVNEEMLAAAGAEPVE